MTRRLQTLLAGLVVFAVLLVLTFVVKVPFVAEVPGPTLNTLGSDNGTELIQIDGQTPQNERKGNLNLTTVGVIDDISVYQAIEGWFDDSVVIAPLETVYPPNVPKKQTDQQNKAQFDQSENNAVAAALGYLGYPSKVVLVNPPEGTAIKAGDALESVNGTAITSLDQLKALLQQIPAGSSVTIGYLHYGQLHSATVTTGSPADGSTGSVLGVTVNQRSYAPFNIVFGENDIGGPSAGLMFTLGIIDIVGPKPLVTGQFIAGTGTIDPDGTVGPIGGIRLKMKKAASVGAKIFLVPSQNCAEATTDPPPGMTLAKVDNLKDAIAAVEAYTAGQPMPHC